MSNYFAQTEALMHGKTAEEVQAEFDEQGLDSKVSLPFKVWAKAYEYHLIEKLTQSHGSLIALYEHKILQGVIWNIFSFDQWGVELGKINPFLMNLIRKTNNHDSSTFFWTTM
jgi:glucose-6-phosphate isomerase